MDKSQKQVTAYQLKKEKKAIKDLKDSYEEAIEQIDQEIQRLMGPGLELTQSKVYQIAYQKQMKAQLEVILDKMNANNYQRISDYINDCYEDGWFGTFYNITSQGIPIVAPINQDAVLKAVSLDSKLSKTLYEQMGINVKDLKKTISSELSRGLASGQRYEDISRNITNQMGIGLNKSIRIARTEGHRVTCQATMDAMSKAKDQGADVVKQWDATQDRKTRPSHQRVDGEIRELDEKFSNGLMHPGDRNGPAAEVINCRCVLLERARWALDEAELKELKQRAEYFGIDKTKNYEDFKQKYLKALNQDAPRTMSADILNKMQKYADSKFASLPGAQQIINDIANDLNITPDEARALISNQFKNIVDNCDVGIRIRSDNLKKVLEDVDGGFKNLYEVGASGGCSDPRTRYDGESKVFGFTKGYDFWNSADKQNAPIYGMFIPSDTGNADYIDYINYGPGSWYGDGVTCVINKKMIKNNASFTCGDSLDYDRYMIGSTMSDPTFNGSGVSFDFVEFIKEKNPNDALIHYFDFSDKYMEVQIFGKENHAADIIEKVYLTDYAYNSEPELIKILKEKNIPFEVLK